jgi:hypothetical protein
MKPEGITANRDNANEHAIAIAIIAVRRVRAAGQFFQNFPSHFNLIHGSQAILT